MEKDERQQDRLQLAFIQVRQLQANADLMHVIEWRRRRTAPRRRKVWTRPCPLFATWTYYVDAGFGV